MSEPLKDGDWGADIFRDPALDQALAERDRLAEVANELESMLRAFVWGLEHDSPMSSREKDLAKAALARYEAERYRPHYGNLSDPSANNPEVPAYEALKEEAKAQAPKSHEQ